MNLKFFIFCLILSMYSFNVAIGQTNYDVIKVPDPENSGDSKKCGLTGSAKDGRNKKSHLAWIGNPHKNRWDFPSESKIKEIDLDELIEADADKKKFKAGTAVRLTGYVYDVKPGGVETCNCGTKAVGFKDTHIELVPTSRRTSAKNRFVVEVTPRLRMQMAEQGIDWSTANLKENILHHTVTITGWLYYDEIHEGEAFSTNPENENGKNWRASPWEIHPITDIQVIDETEDVLAMAEEDDDDEFEMITPTSGPIVAEETNDVIQQSKTPGEILQIILLGGILGMIGQGLRTIVGLKKLNDESESKSDFQANFDSKRILLSLLISGIIGLISGALMAIDKIDGIWDKSTLLALIAGGYAGADFIEGFLSRQFPKDTAMVTNITRPPANSSIDEGPIEQ